MTIDEFADYDVVRMDEDQIRGFLSSQSVGVLGLPTDGAPSMRPLSYWFDEESRLYFIYVLGSESRKAALSTQTDVARFLVYRADTMFNWQSVLLTGTISEVPESERQAVEDVMDLRRRPDALEQASAVEETKLYRFEIDEQVGIEHIGLPPGFERESDEE